MDTVSLAKEELRKKMLSIRQKIETTNAGEQLKATFLKTFGSSLIPPIAGYWPKGSEIDSRPLLYALHTLGYRCCLPATQNNNRVLLFHEWTPETTLTQGQFQIAVPPQKSPLIQPNTFLLPLLAFDKKGYRLGYGLGHYDMTLASYHNKKPLVIGLAYHQQEVDNVPHIDLDYPLKWVATEMTVIQCESS